MDMQELLRMQALLLETVEIQKKQLAQSARLLEGQQQEAALLRQQLADAAAALQQSAQRLESGGQRLGQDALRVIGAQGGQTLAEGAEQKLHKLNQGIEHTTARLEQAGNVAREQALTLTRAQTTLVWKSLSILAVGSLLALCGVGAWAWTKKQEADRHRVEADLGRIINQADVIQCDGGLCANIETNGKRHGDKGQYRPVKTRP